MDNAQLALIGPGMPSPRVLLPLQEGSTQDGAARRLESDPPAGLHDRGDWTHSSSGLVFPRGTLVTTTADDGDLNRIADGSARRGVQAFAALSRKIRRSARDESQLQALCEWLHGYQLDILGTVTYSDDYAESHGIRSLAHALADVDRGLREMWMRNHSIRGYRGRYVLAGEWHPSGRKVPHVHLALDSMGVVDSEKVCGDLFRYFKSTRGRCRFEPMRDATTATLYGLKDTIKASEHEPDTILLKLNRHRALRGRTQ